VFARRNLTEGMSGHISVRDPENPHTFWTNPLGKHFGLLKPSDMVLVDYDGKVVGGSQSRPANAAGFLIHSAIHKARPDVNAACHCHGVAGKAWSAMGKRLDMINQDVCYFYGDAQAVYEDFGGIVFSEEEGKKLAAALGPRGKGMILRNHGLLVGEHHSQFSGHPKLTPYRPSGAPSTKPLSSTPSWSAHAVFSSRSKPPPPTAFRRSTLTTRRPHTRSRWLAMLRACTGSSSPIWSTSAR
jgi:ribulose-5-phosphate 4-epimerase/fuculose-1-phosphate aldolase